MGTRWSHSCVSVLHWYDERPYIILRPIIHFVCAFQLETIHHHHTIEETFYFPAMEEKLGKGTLSRNIEEHEEFVPKMEALEEWCKKVEKGEVVYDGKVFLGMVEAFADTLFAHMNNVRSYLHSFLVILDVPSRTNHDVIVGTPNFGPRCHASKVYRCRTQRHKQ